MLGVLLLGGCGKVSPGAERVVVRMWTFPMLPELRDHELYGELERAFEREHPEIDVQVEMLPWAGRMPKMITAISGNRAPDAVYLNLDFLLQFLDLGLLRPIDEYLTPAERADYDPTTLEGVTYDGRVWMYPMLRSVAVGLYNKDLFAKAGLDPEKPPRNWEELERAVKAITKDTNGDGRIDQWGLAYIYGGETLNFTFWPLLWQAGGEVLTPDGRAAAFGGEAGREALRFIVRFFQEGHVPQSYLGLGSNEFPSGKVGYWLGAGQLEAKQLRRDAPDLNFGVAPALEHKARAAYGTIGSFAMFKSSRHPKETALWLSFLTRPDNMKLFCRTTGFLPAKRSLGAIYADDPILGKLEKELIYCRPDVKSVASRQIMQRLVPEIQAAALGKKTPDQALADAAQAVNQILAKGRGK